MKTFLLRTISGAVYVVAVVASIFGGPFIFGILFAVLMVLGLFEFHKLISTKNKLPGKFLLIILGLVFYITFLSYIWQWITVNFLLIAIPVIFLLPIIALYLNSANPIRDIGLVLFGLVYIVTPMALINLFFYRNFDFNIPGYEMLLSFFLILWVNDTFAYLAGISFGRNKMTERISPNKTWEGFFGGLAGSLISGYVLSLFFFELNLIQWFGFSIIVVIFGTFGDLFESLLKRTYGVKDSGNLIPGHGGILDRLDSLLIATPFIFLYFVFLNN
ncbi:MAG: phosphatidate cytidylyltransferase [Bacteroidales bacterium]|nr:phosphatidate cytidylyltransferase [Bacteroidales bacterium]